MPIDDLRKITADWLREAMDVAGHSPEELAKAAGLAKSTIYRLLDAEVQPEEGTIARLQAVLDFPYPRVRPIKSDALPPGRPLDARSQAGAGLARLQLTPQEREQVSTAVLRHLNDLVEEVPLADLIELFEREERWLKRHKHFQAAEQTALLRAQLIGISQELRKRGTR